MTKRFSSPFVTLCAVGFFARMSYAMARTPLLPLFALSLGASPKAIGFVVGASTITGIFFKLPAGTLSDIYGRYRMLFLSILVFAFTPFLYYLVTNYWQLVGIPRSGYFCLWSCGHGYDCRHRWQPKRCETFFVLLHYYHRKPHWRTLRWIYTQLLIQQWKQFFTAFSYCICYLRNYGTDLLRFYHKTDDFRKCEYRTDQKFTERGMAEVF